MGVKIQLFEVGAYRSDLCLWGWMKREVCKKKKILRGLSPRANYTDRAAAAGRRS